MIRQKLRSKFSSNSVNKSQSEFREQFSTSSVTNEELNEFMAKVENEEEFSDEELFELQTLNTGFKEEEEEIDYDEEEEENLEILSSTSKESDSSIETIWKTEDISLSKKEQRTEEIELSKAGCYQFTFTKTDKIASRFITIYVNLLREGKIITTKVGGVGGLKWSRIHRMEFTLNKPAIASINIVCGSITTIGRIKFNASLVCNL